jgi:hypothetical protein
VLLYAAKNLSGIYHETHCFFLLLWTLLSLPLCYHFQSHEAQIRTNNIIFYKHPHKDFTKLDQMFEKFKEQSKTDRVVHHCFKGKTLALKINSWKAANKRWQQSAMTTTNNNVNGNRRNKDTQWKQNTSWSGSRQ